MKKVLLVILIFMNLISLSASGFLIYYYQLLFGVTRYTYTFMLPLIVVLLCSVIAVFFMVSKKKLRWGVISIPIALILLFLVGLQVFTIGTPMHYSSANNVLDKTLKEEDQILMIILSNMTSDGRYVVVNPLTEISGYENNVKYVFSKISPKCSDLVEQFFEINNAPTSLTLISAPEDGYLIDYDGQFTSLFEEGGSGWTGWRSSYPNAHFFVQVSVPAYDPTTGYAIVYIGRQGGYLSGRGEIILYKYNNGTLITLAVSVPWIS